MWRKGLAILGLLIFIGGLLMFAAEFSAQQRGLHPGYLPSTRFLDSGALIVAGIGLLLEPLLTLPWWRHRLKDESRWWEKRDEPLDGPPRVPS